MPKLVIKFIEQPDLSPHPTNPAEWMVFNKDWLYKINEKEYWIPKGYWYDGASIPRVFWSIIGAPTTPAFWAGAGAHDSLYLTHATDRSTADEVIFQLLLQSKVPLWKARIIWGAVRSCAGFAWKNTNNDIIELAKIRTEISIRPDKEKFQTLWN